MVTEQAAFCFRVLEEPNNSHTTGTGGQALVLVNI